MFRFTPIALSLALVACGGGSASSGGLSPQKDPLAVITNTDTALTISGDRQLQMVNKSAESKLTISGNENAVVIKSKLSKMTIVGDGNSIDLDAGGSISECSVSGKNNLLKNTSGTAVQCTVSGAGNIGFN